MEVPEDDEMDDATEDLDFRFHDIDTEPGTRARKAPVPREMTDNDDDFEDDARAPVSLPMKKRNGYRYLRTRVNGGCPTQSLL